MASCKKDAKGRKLGKGESYRSDGRYCYSYTICGERKWLYASDLAELRELERRIEHDKDDGIRTQEASKITLNDMFETYIATKTKLKTSTRENYLYLWNKYIRPTPLAHQSLINIKTSDIKKLYGELLANGFRTNSLDSINNLVHPTLEMAVDDDLIRKNPSKGVYRALKEKDCKKRVALTLAQQQAFLNYINQSPVYHHWTPIFVTLLGTGMRIAECVGLTRKDIDFENELISVNHNLLYRKIDGKCRFLISTPKTASSIRFIPMCSEVLAELAGLIAILDTLYTKTGQATRPAPEHHDRLALRGTVAGGFPRGFHSTAPAYPVDITETRRLLQSGRASENRNADSCHPKENGSAPCHSGSQVSAWESCRIRYR